MKKLVITPFLIFFGAISILLFFMSIYYTFINNSGGMALGGAISFIGLILFSVILTIEQLIIKYMKLDLNIVRPIEIIILIILGIYIYFNGISIG